jgi:tetratricopeptide (TPR) repeat protein
VIRPGSSIAFAVAVCAFFADRGSADDTARARQFLGEATTIISTVPAGSRTVQWDTWVAVGEIQARLGDKAQSVSSFAKAWQLADAMPDEQDRQYALHHIGDAQADCGQTDEACAEAARLKSTADRVQGIQEIAWRRAWKRDATGALRALGRLPTEDSEARVEGLHQVGVALARHQFQSALRIADELHANHRFAQMLVSHGQTVKSEFLADRLAIKRCYYEGLILGMVVDERASAGRFAEAFDIAARIAFADERDEAFGAILRAAFQQDKLEICTRAYEQIPSGPHGDSASISFAGALARAGKMDAAAALADGLEFPERALARWSIAAGCARRGNYDEAQSWYSRALKNLPETAAYHRDPAQQIVVSFGEGGHYDLAMRFAAQFKDPCLSSDSLEAVATQASKRKDNPAAQRLFEQSRLFAQRIEHPGNRVFCLLGLAESQLDAGDPAGARLSLDAVTRAWPESHLIDDDDADGCLRTAALDARINEVGRATQVLQEHVAKVAEKTQDSEERRTGLRETGKAYVELNAVDEGLSLARRQKSAAVRRELLLGLSRGLLDKAEGHAPANRAR